MPESVASYPEPISSCRICGSAGLVPVLNLGLQSFTGVFPATAGASVPVSPLELVLCESRAGQQACGCLQLRHSFDPSQMYGENYGYRSSLNASMVDHLARKAAWLAEFAGLEQGDLVVDIGSNDGTLLASYPDRGLDRVGVDPTISKFLSSYPPQIATIPDFFSAQLIRDRYGNRKAQLITSVAMFYDLEAPARFMQDVSSVLAPDGLWHFEQSYLPSLLDAVSYDTVCHEHLEYYGLRQIQWMASRCGLKIVEVQLNSVNGGSFAVTAALAGSHHPEAGEVVSRLLKDEDDRGLTDPNSYAVFRDRVERHKRDLLDLLSSLRRSGLKVAGFGASTKGNVLLQFCGLSSTDLPFIVDVNPDKWGCFTPGTNIPIVSEAEGRARKPDVYLVLPWHFKEAIIRREATFLSEGGRLIFPLPVLEIVTG